VCPVKINIHEQLYDWRQVLVKNGHVSSVKAAGINGMAVVLSRPAIYRIAGAAGRWFMKYIPAIVNNKFNPWYKQREMPAVPKQSFNEWYRQNRKENGKQS
jgi:L-lactate dehydrogenase complex protein LldF